MVFYITIICILVSLLIILSFLLFKKIEDNNALRESLKYAEQASKAKNDFLATISHEIRTPISGVITSAELLAHTRVNDEQKEYVNIITKSGNALLALINNVLDLSKIEAEKFELFEEPFSIEQLADNLVVSFTQKAASKNVALKKEIDPKLPADLVGDVAKINQVLINLLENSIKFTDQGHVKLSMIQKANNRKNEKNIAEVRFSIEDTGIGISKDKLAIVLMPFHQGDNSLTRKYGGTGLGLSICKKIVEKMNSELKIESSEGKGTHIWFDLSMTVQPHGDPVEKSDEFLNDYLGFENIKSSGRKIKTLIADDNVLNQKLMAKMLKKAGLDAELAYNGKEAFEKASKKEFDLIFMDVSMPEMNGLEATKAIRNLDGIKQPKIVALTANALISTKTECLDAGMDEYLPKPITFMKLANFLHEILEKDGFQALEEQDGKDQSFQKNKFENLDQEIVNALHEIKTITENDAEFINSFIEDFHTETNTIFDDIIDALLSYKLTEVRDLAHKLKTDYNLLGGKYVAGLAKELEYVSNENDFESSVFKFHELEKEGRSFNKRLKALYKTEQKSV